MLTYYMDVHIDCRISGQLRSHGIDVLTAQEDNAASLSDRELLERALLYDRIIFTQDSDFLRLAREWQREGRPFAGVLFGKWQGAIGAYVHDLELIANASAPEEWKNKVTFLPL